MQQTSMDAYHTIKPELGNRQKVILDAIRHKVNPTNTELSHYLGLPINQVTPRVKELREFGMVKEGGLKKCSITGRTVNSWSVV